MKNIAIFLSGRILDIRENVVPLIINLKKKYNVKLFLSVNSFTIKKGELPTIIKNLETDFGDSLGYYNFEYYMMPYSFVKNRLDNGVETFSYNSLSCFYNDKKNMQLIEQYEKDKGITFDLVCKTRSEILYPYNDINFIFDNENDLIIRNKHMQWIRYWGHIYKHTPLLISDAFAYGNKISMQIYCDTYDWILKNDLEMKGQYIMGFEIYLTDSILNYRFYNIPGGEQEPLLTAEQIINKYENNPNKIKILTLNDMNYYIIPIEVRQKNNFIVNKDNVFDYTRCIDEIKSS